MPPRKILTMGTVRLHLEQILYNINLILLVLKDHNSVVMMSHHAVISV